MKKIKAGSWALVTGASSGMGADFARLLAERGYNLVITARRGEELDRLKVEIQSSRPAVEVMTIAGNLADKGFRSRLLEATASVDVETLINNAGVGLYGTFDATDPGREDSMLDLDVNALVHLTRSFSARMRTRGKGFILETASIAAFQPCPLYASYGAAKAFVLSYGIASRVELSGSGVSVMVLCPGVTETAFFDVAEQKKLSAFQRMSMMKSAHVSRGALRALFAGRATYTPGALNRANAFLTRFFPRTLAARIAGSMMR
jgi:short-subunit dehydrogenase